MNLLLFLVTLSLSIDQGPVFVISDNPTFIQISIEGRPATGFTVYYIGPEDKKSKPLKNSEGKRYSFKNFPEIFTYFDNQHYALHLDMGLEKNMAGLKSWNYLLKKKNE